MIKLLALWPYDINKTYSLIRFINELLICDIIVARKYIENSL